MKKISLFLAASTVTLLAACGGGGSNGGNNSQTGKSFEEMAQNGRAFLGKYKYADTTTNLPTNATATYNGVAAFGENLTQFNLRTNAEFMSRVRLNADFGKESIDGEFYNFRDAENNVVDGSVNVMNGKISGSIAAVDIDGEAIKTPNDFIRGHLSGKLTTKSGDVLDVYGGLNGRFVGDKGRGLIGETHAILSPTGHGSPISMNGIFGAEK